MKCTSSNFQDILSGLPQLAVLSLILFSYSSLAQQRSDYTRNTYTSGQHMEVAYEGWRENDDGSFSLLFGYFNHNWEQELDIPIGNNNFFTPGKPDRGQPTHFLPRRNRFTFEVNVPSDFADNELVWEITSPNGITRRAFGSLELDYKLDNITIASETGSMGAGTSSPESRANTAPVVVLLGDASRTVPVGEALKFQAKVTDDGIPDNFDPVKRVQGRLPFSPGLEGIKVEDLTPEMVRNFMMMNPPSKNTVNKNNGLFLSWNVYRGPSGSKKNIQELVHFEPPQVKPWEDTRPSANSPWSWMWIPPEMPEDGVLDVAVTFDEPGTYVLWGRADDGGLFSDAYLTVNVVP